MLVKLVDTRPRVNSVSSSICNSDTLPMMMCSVLSANRYFAKNFIIEDIYEEIIVLSELEQTTGDPDQQGLSMYLREVRMEDGGKTYSCTACGVTTKWRSSMNRHLVTVHAPKQDLNCGICGTVYKNNLTFQEHLRRKRCHEHKPE